MARHSEWEILGIGHFKIKPLKKLGYYFILHFIQMAQILSHSYIAVTVRGVFLSRISVEECNLEIIKSLTLHRDLKNQTFVRRILRTFSIYSQLSKVFFCKFDLIPTSVNSVFWHRDGGPPCLPK